MMEMGRGGAYVPARVALQGRIHRSSPRTMRDAQNPFPVWKRRYADVRAGTQAPPLRFRLGRLHVGRLVSFGQVARGMGDFVWVDCAWVVLFVGWLVKTVHMNQHHRCCTFVSAGLIERSEIYPG